MRFHRNMLRARRSICLLNHDLRLLEALLHVTMPNAKAMADIAALLWTYAEIGCIVVRNGMMFVYKRGAFRCGLDSIEQAGQWFVLHLNQVQRLISLTFRRCGNGGYRITHKTHALCGQ